MVLVAIVLLLKYRKDETFLLMNIYHTNFLNTFFIYFTYLGDGLFVILLGLFMFFIKKRKDGIIIISSYLMSGGIAQILKEFIVEARPGIFLQDSGYPYFIEDITLHNMHAFPSGHTASAFALAASLAFAAKKMKWQLIYVLVAALVGYSRIYLAQHFLQDVLSGAVIGVMSAIISQLLYYRFGLQKVVITK